MNTSPTTIEPRIDWYGDRAQYLGDVRLSCMNPGSGWRLFAYDCKVGFDPVITRRVIVHNVGVAMALVERWTRESERGFVYYNLRELDFAAEVRAAREAYR